MGTEHAFSPAKIAGLLAPMLLTDARRAARTDTDGSVVPFSEQRRQLWDANAIAEVAAGGVVARDLQASTQTQAAAATRQ